MADSKRIFLGVSDVRLCCVDFGGDGPAALLLHGLAGRGSEWWSTAQWLRQRCRVVALDQRGHGRSEKGLGDYSRDAYVRDVVEVIEQLQLAPVLLIGQSMGGQNAFLVAARYPQLVRALIVVEAAPDPSPTAQQGVARRWRSAACVVAISRFPRRVMICILRGQNGGKRRRLSFWMKRRGNDICIVPKL